MNFIKWEDLIEVSKGRSKVVVSGCQRSGTTYAARALAEYLEFHFYDEREFKTDCIHKFEKLLALEQKAVIHAPALLHELKKYENSCLIVIVHRNKQDVINSMKNHNWFEIGGKKEWAKFSSEPCPGLESIYETKTKFSEILKKVDLEYEELKKTEGFVKERVGWSIKQTSNEPDSFKGSHHKHLPD